MKDERMKNKEFWKTVIQIIVAVLTAVTTTLGVTRDGDTDHRGSADCSDNHAGCYQLYVKTNYAREAVMAPWHNLYLGISICLL